MDFQVKSPNIDYIVSKVQKKHKRRKKQTHNHTMTWEQTYNVNLEEINTLAKAERNLNLFINKSHSFARRLYLVYCDAERNSRQERDALVVHKQFLQKQEEWKEISKFMENRRKYLIAEGKW